MSKSQSTTKPRISFRSFMKIINKLRSSSQCVSEAYLYYVYRADTRQVLARNLDGYEAAKTRANQIRQQFGFHWDQIKFKAYKKSGTGYSSGGRSYTDANGVTGSLDYSSRHSSGREFLGVWDPDGSYHDID